MKKSAGILLYKKVKKEIFIFLVHPGGPFWKNKDAGSWSIPKGEFTDNEEPLNAAKREFAEETGTALKGIFTELKPVKMKSGKFIYAWSLEGDIDISSVQSNTFEIEWPPKSGTMKSFPEIDKAAWFSVQEALQKINIAQASFIEQIIVLQG